METMVAKRLAAGLPNSLPRRGYKFRSVHWGRIPGAKIGMSSGNTWGNRVLHLCLRHCLRHVLPENGTGRAGTRHYERHEPDKSSGHIRKPTSMKSFSVG